MFHSKSFGRLFWVDDNQDFRSCPQYDNGTGDFDNQDYVSEWDDLSEVNMNDLFAIHSFCLNNLWNHANSLTMKDGL